MINRRATSFTTQGGFTLVEMLVVIGVIIVLLGLVVPALGPIKGSQDVTTAAYNLAGALENARSYAMANNTYTWVGFYEQDYASTSAPTNPSAPPYKGLGYIGHLTIGTVYSKDGTNFTDGTSSGMPLPPLKLGQVGKVINIYGVHLKALDAPTSPNSADPSLASRLQGRPYQTDLKEKNLAAFEQSLISSESPDSTVQTFVAQGYTFYKTIRFDPQGEANINSTLPFTRIIEFGLLPTHGGVLDTNSSNLVAIQLTGIGGAVNIYRP